MLITFPEIIFLLSFLDVIVRRNYYEDVYYHSNERYFCNLI